MSARAWTTSPVPSGEPSSTTKASTALIDKAVLPNLATAPQNMAAALYINDKFWLENLDKLNQRFNAWAAK